MRSQSVAVGAFVAAALVASMAAQAQGGDSGSLADSGPGAYSAEAGTTGGTGYSSGTRYASASSYAGSASYSSGSGYRGGDHFGLVLQANAEYGGDNVLKVFYRNGDTQDIKAGQGVTLAIGAHYQPASIPVDFTATVGYKFVRTSDYDTDLGIDRVVIALTGTYKFQHNFWVDAGPVWHTGTKLKGDGWVPDINFDDAVGVTVGAGWRWFGISYTNIHYSSPETGSVDGSSAGITFAWKF